MKKYQITSAYVNFNSGTIELTEDQYRRRRHALKHIKGNKYEIVKPTGFKQGELVGYDGEVNKSLLKDVTPLDELKKELLKKIAVCETKEQLNDLHDETFLDLLKTKDQKKITDAANEKFMEIEEKEEEEKRKKEEEEKRKKEEGGEDTDDGQGIEGDGESGEGSEEEEKAGQDEQDNQDGSDKGEGEDQDKEPGLLSEE